VAIDTSLPEGSVAASDGHRLAVVSFAPAQAHARRIGAALAEATAGLGWRVGDADVVAVIRGPGSFTGLRVGIGFAKGIAWASRIPLVAPSAFEVVAEAAGIPGEPLHAAFDAGRGEVFAALVIPDAAAPSGWQVGPPRLVPTAEFLAALPSGAIVTGPGIDLDALPGRRIVAAPSRRPSADPLVRVAARLADAGAWVDPALLVPDYSRPSYAQENPALPSP